MDDPACAAKVVIETGWLRFVMFNLPDILDSAIKHNFTVLLSATTAWAKRRWVRDAAHVPA